MDVQRSGGYDKAVDLSVQGLPAAAGTASSASPRLTGLAPHMLGTKLDLDLDGGGGEGVHALQITPAVWAWPRPIRECSR